MKLKDGARGSSAVVVLIDAHAAVIDRCDGSTLTRIHKLSAMHPHGTSDHMGNVPSVPFHTGTHGETATEAAERAAATVERHFIHRVAPMVADAAGANEWIVVGGNPSIAADLQLELARSHGLDPLVADNINHAMSADTLVERVNAVVNAERQAHDIDTVRTLLERTGAHTTGVAGPVAALDAATTGAAAIALVTPQFRSQHPADYNRIAAAVEAHAGRVETVSGEAAVLLDEQAGGVGALLRYATHAIKSEEG
jgi:stalled ribosome rescue protein Dom34